MSQRTPAKSRVKVCNKSVFHLQDKKADENELSIGLIKSAKRTGQLALCNRGLGTVPENVWKINELVLEETKDVDFARSDHNNWWNSEPLKMLDLSSNVIKTLSPNIKLLQELVTLKLHDNALTSLPAEIGELSNLTNLSLDHNKLESLPKDFYKLTELRWLSISHNTLSKIEPDFGDLVMLTFLDLSHNKLTVLPPGMGYLVRLVELNLSHNELLELPPDIVNLRELRKFNVSNNNLKRLPSLGELRKMEILDANHNNIDELPDFYGCEALKEIYIANNYIKEITEEFCDQMQQLNVLNIRDNQVEVLPENISLLKTLKRFDLSNNNLNKLPRNLGLLSQLQSISMEGNKLSSVRQDIIKGGTGRMMKYLRDRIADDVLSETRLEDNWPDKFTMKKSQALMVPSKELTSVPEDVFRAAADAEVHIVDISKNKLTSVPLGIQNLRETLTQLLLSSNNIESVPPEVAVCTHLQYIDLGKNHLADLPIELGDLKNLRELVISNNKFIKIPRCVYELENLEILLAAENQISEINVSSDALARLRKLAVLDLTNNSILSVPPELGNFTHLRSLELMGNCFRQPRHAVLAKDSEAACAPPQSHTFVRWSGMSPEDATPVFMYSASGDEESLTGACLARCRELEECAAVVVAYSKGSCQGVAGLHSTRFRADNDVVYFNKICLKLPENCSARWWSLESTPGYYLNSEDTHSKVLQNTTVQQCYDAVFSTSEKIYRSAQWIDPGSPLDTFALSDSSVGNCILNIENKFTEPESYRVSNYYTVYIENQCSHDYPKKIDRCSYEEYYNQSVKHVDLTARNYTKSECKSSCEAEKRFICRGFTWTATSDRGICDLHSEDLVTAGSWLLRRVTGATYYRRVICLNISVECEGSHLVVTYKPRVVFRGRVYVPGRGEHCGARALTPTSPVRLALPMYGDCDVNFAYAITKGPNGNVNRTMAYVMLMIQNNPIIQTAGDRWVRVGCSPGAGARGYTKVDATVAVQDSGRPSLASEASVTGGAGAGASAVFDSTAPLTMYVVRAHGDSAAAPAAVSLGELLELRIETTEESEIEAYHLVASSRLGDSSVLLLDSRGCPTGQVDFPSFTRTRLAGTQRLSARFKAFRFPTSHVIRFAIMVRFCEEKCPPVVCGSMEQLRNARNLNDTYTVQAAKIAESFNYDVAVAPRVVAQGGRAECGGAGRVPLELEMVVGSRDVLTADTLVRADHRASDMPEATITQTSESAMVCIHELLLVALVLIWLAVQVVLLLGCCVLVKRYRNLAAMSMQKDYQSFDNVGFDTGSTHRRVHWPDQNIDIIHAT